MTLEPCAYQKCLKYTRVNTKHIQRVKHRLSEQCLVVILLQNEGPPVAGGTVFVKLKPCKYSVATGSRVESSEHSHTRRYILPRLKSYYNSLQISKQY